MNINVKTTTAPTRTSIGESGATHFCIEGPSAFSRKVHPSTRSRLLKTFGCLSKYIRVVARECSHTHTVEDHAFVVLQGKGTFYFGDGSVSEAVQYEGSYDSQRDSL